MAEEVQALEKEERDKQAPENLKRRDVVSWDRNESKLSYPSLSDFGAPILLVKKNDGTFRMCINYRRLNAITKKDSFPLPLSEDLIDKLTGAHVFSKIDLKSRFHQVKMDPASIERTTFVTPSGAFEWLVMPMGLANAPATFQRLMQRTLGHLAFCGAKFTLTISLARLWKSTSNTSKRCSRFWLRTV